MIRYLSIVQLWHYQFLLLISVHCKQWLKGTLWNFWQLVALWSNVFTCGFLFCLNHSCMNMWAHMLMCEHAGNVIHTLIQVSSYSTDHQLAEVTHKETQQHVSKGNEEDLQLANMDINISLQMFSEERNALKLLIRPQGYTQCILVRKGECFFCLQEKYSGRL